MTRTLSLAVLAALLLAAPAVRAADAAKPEAVAPADAVVTIPVGGMTCNGCVDNVTGKLQAIPGVKTVKVELERKRARVTYDAGKVSAKTLVDAIKDAGFEPGVPSVN